LKSKAGEFYIKGVKYTLYHAGRHTSTIALADQLTDQYVESTVAEVEKEMLKQMQTESVERYPKLFSADEKSAIPLWVKVTEIDESQNQIVRGSIKIEAGLWNQKDDFYSKQLSKDIKQDYCVVIGGNSPPAEVLNGDYIKIGDIAITEMRQAAVLFNLRVILTALAEQLAWTNSKDWQPPLNIKRTVKNNEILQLNRDGDVDAVTNEF
jgi:hypothetical protein